MTVKDLADKLELRTKDVLKKLLDKRIMMTINTTLDVETATMIAREFGAEVQLRSFEEELLEVETVDIHAEDRVTRAPVVTVMGHVDHGKTTLLDGIRETRVAEREAGGITQHIGAYHVQVNNRSVVFLDTPGHEAFTLMRARGARVTDIVILVVAADDGVMPQTREAIDHAKAAGVPIIVAINKIDKPDANAERVKRELSDLGLMPEEWGGQTVMVEVSAKKRQNLDLLLEMILLVTDIGDLKANPKRAAVGTVLEAELDKGRGPVATILVQDGTLHIGDTVIAGPILGKVRALIDDRGRHVKAAGPSIPVEVLGLAALPQPGDSFQAINDAAKARQVALFRQTPGEGEGRVREVDAPHARIAAAADRRRRRSRSCRSSSRPTCRARPRCSPTRSPSCRTRRSRSGSSTRASAPSTSRTSCWPRRRTRSSSASASGPTGTPPSVAEREHVDIRLHSIIYNVIDEMKKAMAGLLEPTFKEVRLGMAEVREVFRVPKVGAVAGCMVTEGAIKRSGDAQARLLRDHVVVFEGKIALAAPVQGRRVRGQVRLRVRHRPRAVQRHQGRRRDRGLRRRARDPAGGRVAPARHARSVRPMVVALLSVELFLPGAGSLKDKRMVLRRRQGPPGEVQRGGVGSRAPRPLAAGRPGHRHHQHDAGRTPSRNWPPWPTRSSASSRAPSPGRRSSSSRRRCSWQPAAGSGSRAPEP